MGGNEDLLLKFVIIRFLNWSTNCLFYEILKLFCRYLVFEVNPLKLPKKVTERPNLFGSTLKSGILAPNNENNRFSNERPKKLAPN